MVKLPFFADQIPLVHDQIMVLFIMVKKKKIPSVHDHIFKYFHFSRRKERPIWSPGLRDACSAIMVLFILLRIAFSKRL